MNEIIQIKQQILDTLPVKIDPCVKQRILLVGDLSPEKRELAAELLRSSLQDLKYFLGPKTKQGGKGNAESSIHTQTDSEA